MLIRTTEHSSHLKPQEKKAPVVCSVSPSRPVFYSNRDTVLTRLIKELHPGNEYHFYSWNNFNLVRLIIHLLKITGPSHLLMTSYSFSRKSIEALNAKKHNGQLLSIKVLVDNRVRVMSPKPFEMLKGCFDYRCISVHAKVALIWNDSIKITVVTSQNATDNPKLERGIIYTDPEIFDFDHKGLTDEFDRGTT